MAMAALREQECEACRADAPKLSIEQTEKLLPEVPEWEVIDIDSVPRLQRRFRFKNFVEAMNFTQKVGELAEKYNHHPAILTEWGGVTISWWTHKIGGLHRNDFVMAAKIDALAKSEN